MRIRLRIERNELPAVNILWTISDTELKQTVAQFLDRVNDRFPLEGESWGLEDYAVSVGGFEALHYSEVGTSFKSEDEVVVKPLQYVDVRARTMTGRNQISEDGRHLVDGIPWGKPLLKRARRPDIRIPPRKKQRTEQHEDQAINSLSGLLQQEEELLDDDDTDDEDFQTESDSGDEEVLALTESRTRRQVLDVGKINWSDSDEDDEDGSEDVDDAHAIRSTRSRKRRPDRGENEKSEESREPSDEQSATSSDASDTSSDDSSGDDDSDTSTDSSDESDDSEESWDGISPTEPSKPAAPEAHTHDSPPDELPFRDVPFEGQEKTRARNARRRDQRRLKYMKDAGLLHSSAKLSDMHAWLETNELPTKAESRRETMESERQRLLQQIAAGGIDVTDSAITGASDRRAGHDDTVSKGNSSEILDDVGISRASAASTAISGGEDTPPVEPVVAQKRARLDAARSARLIFGSLGVRTPQTQTERDALQKKLADRSRRNGSAAATQQNEAVPDDNEDSEAWRTKIDISAVECCDAGVILSEPPFPFEQRWDPQYQYSQKRRHKKRKHNGANGKLAEEIMEIPDKYNVYSGSDALNYDEAGEDELIDHYWEDGALLGGEEDSDKESFPDLPTDVGTLQMMSEGEARQGDIIIFEELACSAATAWQPKTIVRTVRLESNDGGSWHVKFANRDLRPREFDAEGNRVYSKFEMEGLSDDEGDEDEKTLLWDAMTNPRLLQRGE